MRGAVHERARRQAAGASLAGTVGDLLGLGDLVPDAAAAQGAEEDVLGAPHDALGHAGRAPRVEDVEVVGGPLLEAALGRRAGERLLVVDGRERVEVGGGSVLHGDERAQQRQPAAHGFELRPELAVEHDRLGVGVVEQVPQLLLDVAVVHVDGDGSELESRQHPLEVLGAVIEIESDVIAGADALLGEMVGEAIRPLVGLGVGQAPVAADERLALGNRVDHPFPEIG